jgi:hypothetical protein
MAVRIESMAEPLPGYRLIERLGGGGFGEVWKAEAPGGLFKAIKFVYGDLEAADDEGARAGQEFKALKRVITVRHPFILTIERFDIIDGQLMIVTELADRTLWDRFRECRSEGLTGIPREELLRYLADTAEALDLMITQYQLQHLDIKPQNLFLVHNHVKVADFGLVKDLEGMLASVTGGVTPVYAAPETFEGKVSRFSDQYSLAIVYQELLTGQRPYSGTTLRQLVLQHCQGSPDLKPLPGHDRPIILRALAKHHEDRFPSCHEFVEALRHAGLPQSRPGPVERPKPAAPLEGEKTERSATRQAEPAESSTQAVTRRAGAVVAAVKPAPQPAAKKAPVEEVMSTPLRTVTPANSDGVLVPALVIGLGTLGLGTLRQLRNELTTDFGSPDALPALRMLYLDTDADIAQRATQGREQLALRSAEVLLTRLHRPSHYSKPREGTTGLETWLDPKLLYRMSRQQTASGVRALGRLAFVDNYKTLARRVHLELEECCAKQALERSTRETGLRVRSAVPRVYLVTSLAGGTGSGMFIDLAYLVRRQLRHLGYDNPEVIGLCYLPPADKDVRRTRELANCFAALTELNYFSTSQVGFSARYELGEIRAGDQVFAWKTPPLQRCQFFALPEGREATQTDDAGGVGLPLTAGLMKTVSTAARLLVTELTSPLGRAADENREPGSGATARPVLYQVTGFYRLLWPRRQLLDQAARAVCRRLVQRWMNKDARPIKEAVKHWVQEKWDEHGFSAEPLIHRYHEGCEEVLGQTPESTFQETQNKLIATLQPAAGKTAEVSSNLAAVMEAMQELEALVGVPEECRPMPRAGEAATYHPGSLETTLHEVAANIVDHFEQKLAELAVWLIEEPSYRLAGAEEALRQLHGQIEQALQAHEQLAAELQQRAAMIYKRLRGMIDVSAGTDSKSTPWKPRKSGAPAGAVELLELMRAFPKFRYQSLIMQRITALYVSLRGLLSDQLREVDFCRARLGELHNFFLDSPAMGGRGPGPAAGRWLFAGGCKSLEEAVRQLESGVGAADVVELDNRMQALLRKQFKALVHVCMTSANVLKALAPAMQKETRSFLRTRLSDSNVAEIFLQQFGDSSESDGEKLLDDLVELFDEANPEVVASSPAAETNFFAVPAGSTEGRLRDALRNVTDGKFFVPVRGLDEIAIYREHTLNYLVDLKQLGPIGQEAYEKMLAQDHLTPHSRSDIVEWGTRAD